MDEKVLGYNIKRLRKIRGLNQKTVYEAAPISRQAYSNIENGKSIPKTSNLIKFAQVLNVDIREFFVKPAQFTTIRFRTSKLRTIREEMKRDNIKLILSYWLNNYNYLEEILSDHRDFTLNDLTSTQPVELANELRKKIGLDNSGPIFDICNIVNIIGIKIFRFDSDLDHCFGISVGEEDKGPVIAVNTNKNISIERQIFTITHELGHLLLHKDSFDPQLYEEEENEEKEANIFASYFLIPNEGFKMELDNVSGLHWVDQVLHLKRIYKVSYLTVLRRLIDLGYVNDNIYMEFAINYKRLYNIDLKNHFEPNSLEPQRMLKSDFVSERLNRLVRIAFEKEIITLNKASEILSLTLSKMKDLVRSWNEIKYATN